MLKPGRIDCVTARASETDPARLAIADIVADHRTAPGSPAARATSAFARLPGCEIFLAPDGHGGYLAFTRRGRCFSIRRVFPVPRDPADGAAPGCGPVRAAAAEACAVVLYARACTSG